MRSSAESSSTGRRAIRGLGLVASLIAFSGIGRAALAQSSVPSSTSPIAAGTVTLVVPLAAGGPIDVLARLFADRVGATIGHAIIVENRPGAAGNVGAAAVARAEPNGRTWLLTVDSLFTVNPHMYASQGFDPDKDLTPIGRVGEVVLMLAINPKVPATTWAELLAYSRTKSLNFGSAGIGSPGHLALEYLKLVAAFDAAHVPFRGASPALQEVLAGNVDGAFIVAGVMHEYVRSGALRALAVSSAKRLAMFPDVPTAIEAGIGDFEARFSNVLAVPAATPEPIRHYLAAQLFTFVRNEDVARRLVAIGTEVSVAGEADTRAWIARERERWGKVVKAASLKAN